MVGETVEIGVAGFSGEDGRVPGGDLPSTLTLERVSDNARSAGGITVLDLLVDELDEVVRKANRNLPGHTNMVPTWDSLWLVLCASAE